MKSCPSCGALCRDKARFCPTCGANVLGVRQRRDDPYVGLTLSDRYLIKRLIGEGGMGRVYEAEQVALEKPVAVKILHQHLIGDEHSVARFVSEAREASRLNHPNIVSVMEFGETPAGVLYLVMEFLRGKPLSEVIANEYPLTFPRVVGIFRQVLLAVEVAHRQGVIHRDLKPDNIFIEQLAGGSERVKVIDFGIAKRYDQEGQGLTSPGMVCGTPEYMSPEQVHGEPLDPRSDVYSLGVILYEMLVGTPPFQAKSPAEVMVMQAEDEPLSPSAIAPEVGIPPSMDAIVLWALTKDREERIESAEMFRRVLDSWLLVMAGDVSQPGAERQVCPSCHALNVPEETSCRFCGCALPSDGKGEGERFLEASMGAERVHSIRQSRQLGPLAIDLLDIAAQSATSNLEQLPGIDIQRYLPLVGRTAEFETILRWVETGGAFRVTGEPGSGKSRLVDELASRSREAGFEVLRISPRDDPLYPSTHFLVRSVAAFLLSTPVEQLARTEDLLAAAHAIGLEDSELSGLEVIFGVPRSLSRTLSRPAEAREALAALRALVRQRAANCPVALLLEDLDLADAPSLLGVGALAEASHQGQILLVTTQTEGGRAPNWVLESLALRPLERDPAVHLAELKQQGVALSPETLALVDVAGGNPFYLDQLVRLSHQGGLPGRVHRRIELLDARIDRLPLHLRQLLQVVAVHRGRLPRGRLLALTEAGEGDLDAEISALESLGLLECGVDWVSASHDLVERAVLAAMPAEVRRTIHARVLMHLPQGRDAAGARAIHAVGAEDHEAATDALDRAAAIAWHGHDPQRAVSCYHQALQHSRLLWGRSALAMEALTRATVEISRRLAAVLLAERDLTTADAVLQEAETFLSAEQPTLSAAVLMDRAAVMLARGNAATAEEFLERALRQTLASEEGTWLQGQILMQLGEIAVRRGQYDRAMELLSEAYGLAVSLDEMGHGEGWRVQIAMGELQRGLGNLEAAEGFLEQAQLGAARTGWTLGVLAAERSLAALQIHRKEPMQAANHLGEAARIARDLGDRGLAAQILLELADVQQRAGRIPQAATHLRDAARLASVVHMQETERQARERLDEILRQ